MSKKKPKTIDASYPLSFMGCEGEVIVEMTPTEAVSMIEKAWQENKRLRQVSEYKWEELKDKRLLLTDRMTRIQRNEWTLLEISPNGEVGKFRNELADTCFWTDLDDLVVVDVLPPKKEDGK